MKTVQLVGDSHVIMHAELKSDLFNWTHCGACTAYGLLSPTAETNSFKTLREMYARLSSNKNSFIFLFGEIDCRVLIYYKHIENAMPIKDIISIAVYRYIGAVTYCRDLGYQVGIHGIIPAVRQTNEYNVKHYAAESDRASINKEFNELCKTKAKIEDIPYFDCHRVPNLMGEDGLVPQDSLLPDMVHVDPKKVHISYHFKTWMHYNFFLPVG